MDPCCCRSEHGPEGKRACEWTETRSLNLCGQPISDLRRDIVARLVDLYTLPGTDAVFGSKGKPSPWSTFILDALNRVKTWDVDEAVALCAINAYVEFELQKPVRVFSVRRFASLTKTQTPASRVGQGWASFALHGEEDLVRPIYLRKILVGSGYKAKWCSIALRGEVPSADAADWNLGGALSEQWARLQPRERCEAGLVTKEPTVDMVWGPAFAGGKQGVRLLVIGLLVWGNGLNAVADGTTVADWNSLAADMALVLRARGEQVRQVLEKKAVEDDHSTKR